MKYTLTVIVAFVSLCLLAPLYADEATRNSHNESANRDKVRVGTEIVDKKSCAFVFDMRNLKFGDPENKAPLKLPGRIYTRFHPEENRWVPDFVADNGYFISPDRFILPGSVVPGDWFGVPGTNFEFLKNKANFAAWVKTDKEAKVLWSVLIGRTESGEPIRETRSGSIAVRHN